MKYLHGGCPEYYLKRFNLIKEKNQVIDFSVNINPLGPPQSVIQMWPKLINKLPIYPTPDGEGIKEFYQKRFCLPKEFILPGNGSTEIIYLLARALPMRKVVILKPSYYDYERASILAGKEIITIYIDPLNMDINELKKQIITNLRVSDALWIGRPNNPTGNILPKALIEEISYNFSKKWIIIDEAFIQFLENCENETFISCDIPDNILVIHSLTKFYALPGLRIGALIANPDVISLVKSKKEPWTVNNIAEEVAKSIYPCHEYERNTISIISEQRKKLYNGLKLVEGVNPIISDVNFLLFMYEKDLDQLIKRLLQMGIFVRDCRNFDGLFKNYFRIGLRTPKENEFLISSFLSL